MMHHIAPRCTITLHKAPFMSSNLYIPKTCKHCGNAFTARTTVTQYCGNSCAKKAYKARKRKEKIQSTLNADMKQKNEVVEVQNPNAVNNKDFLSVTEASQLIGVSRWTIQRMIQQGRLKAVPFGRKRIVARWQIENLFN
ncbi:excisionase family DNA binding protein [Mesonia hippocampi]|uniref:Excisionase family DNA binding protein n=4 Tax=Flavobacteriales TaxID=200644 RepID=A0A840EMZ0_9FLAO|nr:MULTISPECIES: helix-turn-helix domain-containing protein [Flavobacteriaceae]MBB4119488.1 excisionase family DNA binding protein [Mesonia hippocampi]MDX1773476.1 helix-turn-helix domain-containing protein [Oceanihabitans sediminis]